MDIDKWFGIQHGHRAKPKKQRQDKAEDEREVAKSIATTAHKSIENKNPQAALSKANISQVLAILRKKRGSGRAAEDVEPEPGSAE